MSNRLVGRVGDYAHLKRTLARPLAFDAIPVAANECRSLLAESEVWDGHSNHRRTCGGVVEEDN